MKYPEQLYQIFPSEEAIDEFMAFCEKKGLNPTMDWFRFPVQVECRQCQREGLQSKVYEGFGSGSIGQKAEGYAQSGRQVYRSFSRVDYDCTNKHSFYREEGIYYK
jgi:hypothetical protein